LIASQNKPSVWITGAGGLIGNYLVQLAPQFASSSHAVGLTRVTLDLLDNTAVRQAFREQQPAAVIHCAAMTKPTDCQAEPALASKSNVETTALLAQLAADIPFVFISTDLVFDGRKGSYTETDAVNPLNVYAQTKAVAEQIVLANPRHTVIRTSLNGGVSPTGDRGFNEQIRNAWQRGQKLSFFTDEFRSPIHAQFTARACWELFSKRQTGLFHVAGSERLSRAQIGEQLARRYHNLNPQFDTGSLKDYVGAPRSPDTSLDSSKAQAQLSFQLPGLSDWLRENPTAPF
jgi:dTDP-4-dehydrorhamnose reductase